MLRPRKPVLATALSLLFACGGSPGPGGDEFLTQVVKVREPARVRTVPVERREMLQIFETTTAVVSENEVVLFPRTTGVVVEVLAEEGDRVETGQVLARLDRREAQNAVTDAELALDEALASVPRLEVARKEAESGERTAARAYEQARRDHDRNVAITQGEEDLPGLLSEQALETSRVARDNAEDDWGSARLALERAQLDKTAAESAVVRARLTVERARLSLSFMDVVAPFDGVLAQRTIRVGDSVGAASPAFLLTDPVELRAVFSRPQVELPLFRPRGAPSNGGGLPPVEIRAKAEALPGQAFRGIVERTSPTIDPQSGNFRVTTRLEAEEENEAGPGLLPGMLVRLEIVTDRHPDALVVPKRAIQREGDLSLLFAVSDGVARRVEVTEGFRSDQDVEVLPLEADALSVGDAVVVVGNRDLEDGSEVVVERAERPARPPDEVSGEEAAEDAETPENDQVSRDAETSGNDG